MKTEEMPRECRSTVYMKDGFWMMREPVRREPRYHMAERLTMKWCVEQNTRIISRRLSA